MRTVPLSVRLAVLALLAAGPAVAADTPAFPQTTKVSGKIPANLAGAWFFYAQATFPGDKTRALQPEIWTISQKGNDLAFRILDVELPKSIDEPYRAGNRQPKAWEPSPADIDLLRKEWSKLPPQTNKDVHRSDVAYGNIEVAIASPDKYGEAFQGGDANIEEALKKSAFAFQTTERYRPLPMPPGENIAQVMERRSFYVVQKVSDSMIEGRQFTGYIAAGPGSPIPIALNGPFRLYRLAKGNVGAPPPAKAAPKKGKGKK